MAGSISYYAVPGGRAVRTGAGLYYVLTDHFSSESVSLDNSGIEVAELHDDAFGATRLSVGPMVVPTCTMRPVRPRRQDAV